MNTAQRKARAFLLHFPVRQITSSDLEQALSQQGFSLVSFSHAANCDEVETLLTSLHLVEYAAAQSAFSYMDAHLRIVFLLENLSEQEKIILLAHELGHVLCRHLERGPVIGPGADIRDEQEANTFAECLLRHNQRCQPASLMMTAAAVGGALLLGLLMALILISHRSKVYITQSGQCYHTADCLFVADKEDVLAVSEAQARAAQYEPCSYCRP